VESIEIAGLSHQTVALSLDSESHRERLQAGLFHVQLSKAHGTSIVEWGMGEGERAASWQASCRSGHYEGPDFATFALARGRFLSLMGKDVFAPASARWRPGRPQGSAVPFVSRAARPPSRTKRGRRSVASHSQHGRYWRFSFCAVGAKQGRRAAVDYDDRMARPSDRPRWPRRRRTTARFPGDDEREPELRSRQQPTDARAPWLGLGGEDGSLRRRHRRIATVSIHPSAALAGRVHTTSTPRSLARSPHAFVVHRGGEPTWRLFVVCAAVLAGGGGGSPGIHVVVVDQKSLFSSSKTKFRTKKGN